MSKRIFEIMTVAGVGMAVLTGGIMATPGTGALSAAVVARSSFQAPVDITFRLADGSQEAIHVPSARETVMEQVILGPGESTGWHSHPGPAVMLVKSGELTVYMGEGGCSRRQYSAGQAFVDSGKGHVYRAVNTATGVNRENAEVWITYFDVPPGGAFRLEQPDPQTCS